MCPRVDATTGDRHRSLLALLAVLALLLAACGEGSDDAGDSGDDDGESEEQADAADDGDDAQAAEGDGEADARVSIATFAAGGGYHTVATGLAALIADHTDVSASAEPYAGATAWMPQLQSGSIQFGLISTMDTGWAYAGGVGYDEPVEEVRVVASGTDLTNIGLVAAESSGIESLSDLEGRQVAGDYGGSLVLHQIATAELEAVGLSWDDVEVVPVPDFDGSLNALRDGVVDAGAGAGHTTPATVETHQAIGLVPLPFGDLEPDEVEPEAPEEVIELLREYVPGARLVRIPAGEGILEDEDSIAVAYQSQLVASTETSDATVTAVLEALWENYEDMHDVHAWARWTPEEMVGDTLVAPVHEAAVRFYEEQGVWTDDHQRQQEELLGS